MFIVNEHCKILNIFIMRQTKNKNYICTAVEQLNRILGASFNIEISDNKNLLKLNNEDFFVVYRNEIKRSNLGLLISQIKEQTTTLPQIIVGQYIATDAMQELKRLNYNYFDFAGNCYINTKKLFIYISGQKIKRNGHSGKTKPFQEAGIKLIFNLLVKPENINLSYRKLAEISNISIGSVSNIISELEKFNFIIKINKTKKLKNTLELLNKWVISYNDILKSRILLKRMRFPDKENYKNWQNLSLRKFANKTLWGGEAGAAILTKQLKPVEFKFFTSGTWQMLAKELKLIPDENGDVEIYQIFWNNDYVIDNKPIVPYLLLYADLISTGNSRNIEIAQIILKNELSYIK